MPTDAQLPAEVEELLAAFDAAATDAESLVAVLTEEQGVWRPEPGSWSVSECLDHLATANAVYLRAMQEPARRGRAAGRLRRRPVEPGWLGRLFIRQLEPPPKWWSKVKAPKKIRPRPAPPLEDTYASFTESHAAVVAFLRENADLDLYGIRFPNPFIPGLRFSLATGVHVLETHERRHLLQAWNVRRAQDGA